MNTIYKYQVDLEAISGRFTISMPDGAEILSVQTQHGHPQMWAQVDTKKRAVDRSFVVFGTGHEIDPDLVPRLRFVGTFQVSDGDFVVHLFEIAY